MTEQEARQAIEAALKEASAETVMDELDGIPTLRVRGRSIEIPTPCHAAVSVSLLQGVIEANGAEVLGKIMESGSVAWPADPDPEGN